mgnify:CR=1 FL=1
MIDLEELYKDLCFIFQNENLTVDKIAPYHYQYRPNSYYYKDDYQTAIIYDKWGNPHYAKDIELITTDNAMKWIEII